MWTDEDQKIMDLEMAEYMKAEKNREAEDASKNTHILNAIEKELSKEYREAVFNCIMESEGYGLFEIVNEPKGNHQYEEWGTFDHIYVDQWEDGGITGDSFAGDIYIPLMEGQYLKVKYQM